MRVALLALLPAASAFAPGATVPPSRAVACSRAGPRPPLLNDPGPITPDDVPSMADDDLQKELSETLQMKEFNDELYSHLNRRPEYETSELYSQLRKRQDVDDPLYSELESRREMLANTPAPNEEQTPGEVIECVNAAARKTRATPALARHHA